MPSDLADYGIDLAALQEMLDLWRTGVSKSELERRYLGKPESHGKLFTALVREHLGVETERPSKQSAHVAELEAEVRRLHDLLEAHGIDHRAP